MGVSPGIRVSPCFSTGWGIAISHTVCVGRLNPCARMIYGVGSVQVIETQYVVTGLEFNPLERNKLQVPGALNLLQHNNLPLFII